MLNALTIEGLTGVGRVELKFAPGHSVRTLFGSNGVGKTKCLEALYQFLLCSNKTFLSHGVRHVFNSSFAVMQSAVDDNRIFFHRPALDLLKFKDLWGGSSEGVHDFPVVLLGAGNRSSVQRLRNLGDDADAGSRSLGSFEQRRKEYFDGLITAFLEKDLAGAGMTGDIQGWFVSRAQSVNPYQKEADNRKVEIDTVLEILGELDGRIDASFLQVDGAANVFLKINDQELGLRQLSSGFTSLVKLVQAIVAGYANFTNERNLRHVRGIVLIDEIESHLHAQWQSRIVPTLKKLLPNTTFYIATHSPLVLAQLEEGEAYLLERDADGVVRSQPIASPNKRAFVDVLADAFKVDLNQMKRASLDQDDQSEAKRALLELLDGVGTRP